MKTQRRLLPILVWVVLMGSDAAAAAPAGPPRLDARVRREVVDSLCAGLLREYVSPDTARLIATRACHEPPRMKVASR